ncbi:TonB family protein [Lysobacter sp. A6]|uniref:Protein TonB n=1 Tax=Noviluteimonas lactosilytica TaxID=2888523 RepID=A0ABS8JDE5_9GAMM|nr:energy transducer TonB [Lysobacter lactosilyticus]MCC8361583.1 TonB family protein [Lysobacter lactosilyticus]
MTSSTAALTRWIPSHRGLIAIGAAFLAGLLLFLIVWSGQRGASPAPVRATADAPGFTPLPAPMPRDADGASGMEEPDEQALADQPRLEEAPRPAAAPAAPTAPTPSRAPNAIAEASSPTPISSPAPRYPQRALRRRETGTVRVQVEVGADGVPTDVSVAASSNSRDLDRAALDAVRKWRFAPAIRDGQAVAGTVVVPIEFRL